MGKSPGRWIKTVLFGKKSSKSNLSKNATPDKKDAVKTQVEDHSPLISTDPGKIELEKGSSGTQCDTIVNEGEESQINFVSVPMSDAETRRQYEAATKAQAAFRGYLARRAFWALKGIIRLQALIRGHLVRRQAVSTLHCMQAVIKLQSLARGRRERLSFTKPEAHKKYNASKLEVSKQVDIGASSILVSGKLARNAYVRKLLLSLPTAMPLRLQYDEAEPNSAWNWLERWSLSRFWDPPRCPKKIPKKKHGAAQILENETGKSKRSTRKASSGDNGAIETDKPKRNPRKPSSHHQTESLQEQQQHELERIKCSLRKASASTTENERPIKPDLNTEDTIVISTENPSDSCTFLETPSEKMTAHEAFDVQNYDSPPFEAHFLENGEEIENALFLHENSNSKEENGKENQKMRKRRSLENVSQTASPSLPSYMAATQSAKAKLRAQGSSKLSEDVEEQGYVHRHSLPASSTNGKMSSLSPRIQKPVQGNGKGNSKSNRLMTSSRDDKVLQPGWRR